MKAYRIAQARHARSTDDLLSGEGARRFGGRWNSPGIPAVYCSQSLSLAALEVLVHLHNSRILERYYYLEIDIADAEIETIDATDAENMAAVGDSKLGPNGVLAFSVESVVMPPERNIVLNPLYPKFLSHISFGEPEPLRIDPRLLQPD